MCITPNSYLRSKASLIEKQLKRLPASDTLPPFIVSFRVHLAHLASVYNSIHLGLMTCRCPLFSLDPHSFQRALRQA